MEDQALTVLAVTYVSVLAICLSCIKAHQRRLTATTGPKGPCVLIEAHFPLCREPGGCHCVIMQEVGLNK